MSWTYFTLNDLSDASVKCTQYVLEINRGIRSIPLLSIGILGQNSAFFRGTLEKMLAEGLQNCPRAGGPRAVLEARGRHLFKSPSEKGGISTLLTGLYHFSLAEVLWEYCFSECPLFGNDGILGRMPPVRKPRHSGQNAPCSETMAFWGECPPVGKPWHSGQNAPSSETMAFWEECPLFENHGILGVPGDDIKRDPDMD